MLVTGSYDTTEGYSVDSEVGETGVCVGFGMLPNSEDAEIDENRTILMPLYIQIQ